MTARSPARPHSSAAPFVMVPRASAALAAPPLTHASVATSPATVALAASSSAESGHTTARTRHQRSLRHATSDSDESGSSGACTDHSTSSGSDDERSSDSYSRPRHHSHHSTHTPRGHHSHHHRSNHHGRHTRRHSHRSAHSPEPTRSDTFTTSSSQHHQRPLSPLHSQSHDIVVVPAQQLPSLAPSSIQQPHVQAGGGVGAGVAHTDQVSAALRLALMQSSVLSDAIRIQSLLPQ
jgi:hypothetical protein